jgi:hypothetical protein
MDLRSKLLMAVLALGICVSIGLTYYHDVYRQDYVVFTDPNGIPDAADFVAYIFSLLQARL